MRKSEQVYTHNGFKFWRDGTNHVYESPKGKRLTRLHVGRIEFVSTHRKPVGQEFSREQWAPREGRDRNVQTRPGLFMDPTTSSMGRLRKLAGNIKQGHNERVRREVR